MESVLPSHICPGICHKGDFADFDHYCDVNNISMKETPIAFGAWLHLMTGWDGDMKEYNGD